MAAGTWSGATEQIQRLFTAGGVAGLSEQQLLDRFVARRDEAAFEALVARHGPMVLGVCRRWLRDPNDVDDAFQATFLVLVRKAGSLRRRELLGNWLYGVASRVALRARAIAAQRAAREGDGVDALRTGEESAIEHELHQCLHDEIGRLHEKYRAPVVLCYLEGLTHEEAAERLGWPLGSVKGRLARARNLLRTRLARRGLTTSGAGALLANLPTEGPAAVPAALSQSTLRAAASWAAGHWAETIAGSVLTLTQGVISAMNFTKLKSVAIALFAMTGLVVAGAAAGAYQSPAQPERSVPEPPDPPALAKPPTDPLEEERPDPPAPPKSSAGSVEEALPAAGPAPGIETGQRNTPEQPNSTGQPPSAATKGARKRSPRVRQTVPPRAHAGTAGNMTGGGGHAGDQPSDTQTWARIRIQAAVRHEIALLSKQVPDPTPKEKAILEKLDNPISMSFARETPFEDVLKYIKSATQGEKDVGVPIYVDPEGLALAEKTMQSPIHIDLEGVPLKTTLRLVLRQLGLAYCVKDGILMISTPEIIVEELKEMSALEEDLDWEELEAEATRYRHWLYGEVPEPSAQKRAQNGQ